MYLHEQRKPVEQLRGVGPVLRRRLDQLGIRTLEQLLRHYPRDHQDRRGRQSLADAGSLPQANVLVRARSHTWVGKGRRRTLKVTVEDDSARAALLCFGRGYLARMLVPGGLFWVWGRFQRRGSQLQASDFEIEAYEPERDGARYARILPVYPLTEGLTQNTLRKLMRHAIEEITEDLRAAIPAYLAERRDCLPIAEALRAVHFPESMEQLAAARRTLVYEELLRHQVLLERCRLARICARREPRGAAGRLKRMLLQGLPFALTDDQLRALAEIEEDLLGLHPGARLLQGEVGSGKTLVALAASLTVVEAGQQVALLVPTELLARQHADNAARLLEPLGVRVAFLAASVQGARRRLLLESLGAGRIDVLIGTHALFSEEVRYRGLGLVIVDEQQRFGVAQRQTLLDRGDRADLLLMSATPIPRTLALGLFGELDVSEIRALPKGRKPVITHLTRQGNEARVYERVRREVSSGGQAYMVYPLIEESEAQELKDAERMYRFLKAGVFSDLHLGLIHSRVEEQQKALVMKDFAAGRIDVLVSTSVLEVGVDVPAASCMVIEHAERFGLSSLHQLRGRVGRGPRQSYAFLIYSRSLTGTGIARLKAIMESSDGFQIAEKDLRIRGPGEFLGRRQAGFLRFGIADLSSDWHTMLLAREDAREILASDPVLEADSHQALRQVLAAQEVAV